MDIRLVLQLSLQLAHSSSYVNPCMSSSVTANRSLLQGFDSGIVTTTIAHQSWKDYFGHPSTAQTGAVSYILPNLQTISNERRSWRLTLQVNVLEQSSRWQSAISLVVSVSCSSCVSLSQSEPFSRQHLSTSACFLLAVFSLEWLLGKTTSSLVQQKQRKLIPVRIRGLIGTVPVYLSEISAPHHRGLIGGISGCGISFGTMMSNWVGFACGHARYGPLQWRLPLGLQIPFGIILFIGLLTFMPDSPRQLVRDGQIEKARREFLKIRRDLGSEEVGEEFAFMQTQIEYEMAREIKSFREIWRLYKHRVLVAVAVQTMTSLTGTNVISYYQSKQLFACELKEWELTRGQRYCTSP